MTRTNLHLTTAVLVCVACLSVSAAASSRAQGSFQRTFQVSSPTQLEIDSGSSDFSIRSGPAGVVTVSGKIHVDNKWLMGGRTAEVEELEKNPPLRQDGNTLHVDRVNLHNISVDYEITVPTDTQVHSRTDSGDVTISGLHGDLRLESTSGDLALDHITGKIQSRTSSGNVRAEAISGPFTAEASSGDIRLEEMSEANIEIQTGSGNIEVSGANGSLRAEAGSGDVSAEGRPAGNWDARTGSGNISLRLPASSAFNLDASTSSGELHVGHAVSITVQGNLDTARHSIKGTVAGGGPTVTAHTGSGDLDID